MDFNTYIEEKTASKTKKGQISIPVEIKKRWTTRIVANEYEGATGAAFYLDRYGKSIGAPKVINLALCAQVNGDDDMAMAFWAKAYELETGKLPVVEDAETKKVIEAVPVVGVVEKVDGLPDYLQPGSVITMQAVDAGHGREYYAKSPYYIGQPKRDGKRLVIIKTTDKVFYQSRSTKLQARPSAEMEECLMQIGGTYILDGELWYEAFDGSEHRTQPQAETHCKNIGQEGYQVHQVYTIFKALFDDEDLTRRTEEKRITSGEYYGALLKQAGGDMFETIFTAYSEEEKIALIETQQEEGREGEIWIRTATPYVGGKAKHKEPMVRTKYLDETACYCVGLTPTTADGFAFGAMLLDANPDGPGDLGKVGTGFTKQERKFYASRFAQDGSFPVLIEHQGRTENGKLWHARLAKKQPS